MRRTQRVFVRILSSSSACRLDSHALTHRERDMSFDVLSPWPRVRIAPEVSGEQTAEEEEEEEDEDEQKQEQGVHTKEHVGREIPVATMKA